MRIGTLAGVLTASMILSACSGDPGREASAPTDTPTAVPGNGARPSVGDAALRVGEWLEGPDQRILLAEVRYPYPPGRFREPAPGSSFVGLRLEQCVRDEADPTQDDGQPYYSTYNQEWFVGTPAGDRLTGGATWMDWPQPKFAEAVTLDAGDCVQGWVTIEVPQRTTIERISWQPGGETIAEWLT